MLQTSRRWTAQEDADLLTFKNSGMSVQRMALRLKRSSRAITTRLAVLRSEAVPEQTAKTEPIAAEAH